MSSTLTWIKSSYSDSEGAECVEVAVEPAWFKSSYSDGEGAECVEVAACPRAVHVRDSKAPGTAQLTFTPTTWRHFLTHTP
ncbi:DUF397 domain-containing protein [Streptomyces sp. YIM 98790]|uniref:DUF397 domain-containing protein n=1 Tax=Streptomyces sp. YIM 98790 TaxID=2689077 RepID=UPI0014092F4E|nr:DUF397 domain-containing protein [Streptomyces sp. YIM 98790]